MLLLQALSGAVFEVEIVWATYNLRCYRRYTTIVREPRVGAINRSIGRYDRARSALLWGLID